MGKHVKAFTAEFKIASVRSGDCCQTIRRKSKTKPVTGGDSILFHGWEGKPRHSKWSWRMRVEVSEVMDVSIYESGIYQYHYPIIKNNHWSNWESETTNELAKRDGFKNGAEMKEWFMEHYGKILREENRFQIIRWYPEVME